MYSMVLMMAMSGSPDTVAFGGLGCKGCDGGCSGCHGGGLFGGLFRGKGCDGGCHGCDGGCHGGCDGGCHGCKGGGLLGGLLGKGGSCHGCSGGGFLGGLFKNKGCHGGCDGGCHGGCAGCHGGCDGGCHGGAPAGCAGCNGGCAGCQGGGPIPVPGPGPGPVPIPEPKKMPEKVMNTPAPASVALNVPADATVTVDGKATKATGAARVFATPELAPGQVYYYSFTATVVRDGKTLTATESVAVKAGETTSVSLNPEASLAVATK